MNYGRKKLNVHLLEVHCSLEIYHITTYTLKNRIKFQTRCGRVQKYYSKLWRKALRQVMGIKDKVDKMKVMWTENVE